MTSDSGEPWVEKRGNARRSSSTKVKIRLSDRAMDGVTKDVSAGGAYVVTGDDLVVEMSPAEGADRKISRARIVRFEKLPGDCIGIALEYLPDE
ncbi:MAG: PilZ domain-containing protein [Planctomycetota bacterium]